MRLYRTSTNRNPRNDSDKDVLIISDGETINNDIILLDDDGGEVDALCVNGNPKHVAVPLDSSPIKPVRKVATMVPKIINTNDHSILPKAPSGKYRDDPFYRGCLVIDLRFPSDQSDSIRSTSPAVDSGISRKVSQANNTNMELNAHNISYSSGILPDCDVVIPPSSPYSASPEGPGLWASRTKRISTHTELHSDDMVIMSSSQTEGYPLVTNGTFADEITAPVEDLGTIFVPMRKSHFIQENVSNLLLSKPSFTGITSSQRPNSAQRSSSVPSTGIHNSPILRNGRFDLKPAEAEPHITMVKPSIKSMTSLESTHSKNRQFPAWNNTQNQGSVNGVISAKVSLSNSELQSGVGFIPKFQLNSVQSDTTISEPAQKKARKLKEREEAKRLKEIEKSFLNQLNMANKRVINKRDTAHEIILDMDSAIFDSPLGAATREAMEPTGVTIERWIQHYTCLAKICQFRRRVTKVYDNSQMMFIPVSPRIEVEDVIIVYVTADEFAEILSNGMAGIESHARNIQRSLPRKKVIYLLEGLVVYIKKVSNNVNNQMRTQVRQLMENESASSQRSKRTKASPTIHNITHEDTMDALVLLQVAFKFKVFQTTCPDDTVEWISTLTQDFSTAPYKNFGMNSELFEVGTVRAGANSSDCFLQALQHMKYVTPPLAEGLQTRFKNIKGMTTALQRGGPDALVGIKGVVGKSIGKSLSSSIYSIFTSRDPDQRLS
ncbi:hypothetical protein NADFUDRAFT_42937 [Nadsonia fulvescens var. elongata DSM 6958]|uniref:ERCC4 domain-containing protein n=1 Tax=Nadsonia fulvescens var. elongata DSM 6958 TaxID=857566 RepID=A0A1E3PGW0_9ASCO|nr:hypothetical protein NADFUDRAFT_42937 [Nadsonia fulvescens var. elongata DSM 6958]